MIPCFSSHSVVAAHAGLVSMGPVNGTQAKVIPLLPLLATSAPVSMSPQPLQPLQATSVSVLCPQAGSGNLSLVLGEDSVLATFYCCGETL